MDTPAETNISPQASPAPKAVEMLTLEHKDVGNLDQVLREYYLSQIKKIPARKDRKLARKLMENHLVLPKSRRRTSKDAAYIKEVLGMEGLVLDQIEQFRLIRRLDKTGNNPIYEVSHDTLVEPILAERSKREAITLFLKKYSKYFLLLLLLLFGFGMLFENLFDVFDDSIALRKGSRSANEKIYRSSGSSLPPPTVSLKAQNGIYAGGGTQYETLTVPFGQIEAFQGADSITLLVSVEVNSHPALDRQPGPDTISLDLGPVPLGLPAETLEALAQAEKDTAIPIRVMIPIDNTADSVNTSGLMAAVEGTALLRISPGEATTSINQRKGLDNNSIVPITAAQRTRGDNAIHADLGQQFVQVEKSAHLVELDTIIPLSSLIKDDKIAQDVLKGRNLRLTYQVDVKPPEEAPIPKVVEYMPVAGIEVQYQDGTKRFIPSATGPSADQPVTHTVQPGETLYKISKLYGVTDAALRKLNNLQDNTLQVGQVLKIK
ncbi:MAG: LysM peptidoglycan-binding domain-containing protein [Bacteroidota bacterium]